MKILARNRHPFEKDEWCSDRICLGDGETVTFEASGLLISRAIAVDSRH
jgi:hypothetical protein